MTTINLTNDTFMDTIEQDGILVFSQPGALPASALDEVITAVRGLDMSKVHEQLAEQESARQGA